MNELSIFLQYGMCYNSIVKNQLTDGASGG